VWDLVRTDDGALWAATGDRGRIFRRPAAGGAWDVAHEAEDRQVLCLAARGGRVAAGTAGGGRVIELDPTGKVRSSTRPDAEVEHIWDLAYAADGALLAATGPKGQLWRRAEGGGGWSLVFDAPQAHLLSLAVGPDGAVYVGTDGGALVYRVDGDGAARVVLDAPQEEVRVLRLAGDGSLLAGTASEAAGGSGGRATAGVARPGRLVRPASAIQGTARLRAGAAGENVVYRIDPDGVAREVFRLKGLVLALAERGGGLVVGTGPEGRLYEVASDGGDATPLARLDHGQILALLPAVEGGELDVAAGDPGAVYRLEPGHVREGTLTSEVLDARLPARFGALSVRSETPPGTSVGVELRTGRISEPDETWSAWVAEGEAAPVGRFAQYRLKLATGDAARTPVVTSVSLAYRTLNLAPEVAAITVPDVSAGDGATRRTKLDLKWEAADPNDDPLVYTLSIRKDEWPDWIGIPTPAPLTERTFSWDTTTVPAGRYRLRVTASDARGNPPAGAMSGERVSEPFLVDHLPPTIEIDAGRRPIRATVSDGLTRVVAAEYSLDGGEWTPVFAADGLFDTRRESIEIEVPDPGPGPHVLVVRGTDAAGNVGSADVVFTVEVEGR
jgi:hypothetical protein